MADFDTNNKFFLQLMIYNAVIFCVQSGSVSILSNSRGYHVGGSPISGGSGLIMGCQFTGCPGNFVCRLRSVLSLTPLPECLPDVKMLISERLEEWNRLWNAGNFRALEDFYTPSSLFLPPGSDMRPRGNRGFGNFIGTLAEQNNWTVARWSVVDVTVITDELVNNVNRFELTNSTGGQRVTGKEVVFWRRIQGVYFIQYECVNFDA